VRPALIWGALVAFGYVMFVIGRRTSVGTGLVGLVFPLLVVEAWISARSRWRLRLARTVAFSMPACTVAIFASSMPGSCCFCDHSPEAKMLRNLDRIADYFLLNSTAVAPAFLVLALSLRRQATTQEKAAFQAAFTPILLSQFSMLLPFGAVFWYLLAYGPFDLLR
jgi:hypothetical protein